MTESTGRSSGAEVAAETLALQALAWLAAQEEPAQRFLAASGAGIDDLRSRAGDPEFLGFVLDFLLSEEESLLAFAESARCAPESVMRARAGLPGGAVPNWT
ncbi:MAG: DUF3572 domain-containing protein [Pseudomonadota bacterium]